MKKVFLVLLSALMMAGTASAQLPIQRGNILVNTSGSNVTLGFTDSSTSFNLGVSGGYFLANKLALMGGLGFGYWSSGSGDWSYSSSSVVFSAGARYYFVELGKGAFFGHGMLNITKVKDVDADLGLNIGAGYAIFLNDRVSLDPMFGISFPFKDGAKAAIAIGGGISVYF